ncbi:MAG TPA: methionyl-tRNA formyltransferase [Candidatus Anaerobutyricum avicola]|nr:methionyl-tRNA formyltransferase [Candidatus Anaerobutyricum avicola]
MRVVFMGTPEFAVPTLEALIAHHEVIAVVTQPDKPKGRGKAMACPPVKETAMAHDIPVYQPVRVREESFVGTLRELQPDVIVVVAFGQILPESILNIPPYGCINVHASLLPKYRGAAPMQWAIINGEKETGITTMYMAKGLDTGDMIDTVVIPIDPKETGETLHDKLSAAGGKLILQTLEELEAGTAKRIPQDDAKSSYAGMLTRALGEIDWTKSAVEIERLIRGLNSWPSAYTYLHGKTLKIWDADVAQSDARQEETALSKTAPGTVTAVKKDCFYVQTGDGQLKVNEVQLQGKKRMSVQAFLLGNRIEKGLVYGR